MTKTTLSIEGMSCGSCVARIEKLLSRHPDIKSIAIDLREKKGVIQGDLPAEAVKKIIDDAGYPAQIVSQEP